MAGDPPGWDDAPALSYSRLARTQLDATDRGSITARVGSPDADELMAELAQTAEWAQRERPMYDAMVVEPRLVTGWSMGELPASLEPLRASLSDAVRASRSIRCT